MNAALLLAIADAAELLASNAQALARLARASAVDSPDDASALLRIAAAAEHASTSKRVVREAIRSGDLPAYGRQRDRAVRRGDLEHWIESRRARPVAGVDDDDLRRRIRRLRAVRGC